MIIILEATDYTHNYKLFNRHAEKNTITLAFRNVSVESVLVDTSPITDSSPCPKAGPEIRCKLTSVTRTPP